MQVPVPSQILPLTAPPAQVVGPQLVPKGAVEQAPGVPEHDGCSPQGSLESTHWLPGLVPCLAASQVPLSMPDCLLAAAQAMHLLLHEVLQQTPSAHKALSHSPPLVQASPSGFFSTHAVPLQ